jgi:hypothetical protein
LNCVSTVVSYLEFVIFATTETPKLAVLLFPDTTKTSLFVSDSVKTSFGSFDKNRVSQDTLRLRICVVTIVLHPKLLVSVQLKLRNYCSFFTLS